MTLSCPNCGSRNLRYSHLRSPLERLYSLAGIRPIRCRDCRTRFTRKIWSFSDLPYARCPQCANMVLSTWSPSHYRVSAKRALLLFLGARPLRCESCRCNFVSFRKRKYRYSRKSTAAMPAKTRSAEEKNEENKNGSK